MPSTNVQKTSTIVTDDDGSEREQVQDILIEPRKIAEEYEFLGIVIRVDREIYGSI